MITRLICSREFDSWSRHKVIGLKKSDLLILTVLLETQNMSIIDSILKTFDKIYRMVCTSLLNWHGPKSGDRTLDLVVNNRHYLRLLSFCSSQANFAQSSFHPLSEQPLRPPTYENGRLSEDLELADAGIETTT